MSKNLRKIKIAVTGGIGSGKSTVLQAIRENGYPVFSCDEIYKSVIKSSAYIQCLQSLFPCCINDGEINRKKLAEVVFENEENRKKINSIAHPMIMSMLFSEIKKSDSTLNFAEVPLLFEGNFEDCFDFVIIIRRDITKRIESIKARDGLSNEEIENRLQAQIDYDNKKNLEVFSAKKFFILENNHSIEELKQELMKVINFLENIDI